MHPSFDAMREVYFALCKNVNTPRSLACWLLFKYHEEAQLVQFDLNPRVYLDARGRAVCGAVQDFANDLLVTEYLSKYTGFNLGYDLKEVAIGKFKQAEQDCAEANNRIRLYKNGRLRGLDPRVDDVIQTSQRKIASLLGDLKLHRILESCRWGKGSTASLSSDEANLAAKIGSYPISVSRRAENYLSLVVHSDPHWLRALGVDADGPASLLRGWTERRESSKLSTVPKNAKTDRVIASEPTGNIFLQAGVGRVLRRRLARVGVDLDTQLNNQRAAKRAWDDGLATIDLSAASDTISKELVFLLLPEEWASLMDSLRCHSVAYQGDTIHLEKFSSMGNGFTFELETLLFWALTSACTELTSPGGKVLVYGDDIIAPIAAWPLIRSVFLFLGFTPNLKKTHWDSPYRESCGSHYFEGIDVTPIYQKEPPLSRESAYRLANRIIRCAYRRGGGAYLDGTLRSAHKAARRCVESVQVAQPLVKRSGRRALVQAHFIPIEAEDDDGLIVLWQELMSHGTSRGHGLWQCDVWSFSPRKVSACENALLSYWFRFGADEAFNGQVTLRRRGKFASRRRLYLIRERNVDWLG